ncbi:MAG: hypothetical protein WHS43_05580 [Aquificaceae bacterium]
MHQEVQIPVDGEFIRGDLSVPPGSAAIVIFVHGSGSSRFSPRNRFVAGYLNRNGLATLLFDLLTEREERVDLRTAQYRFNICQKKKRGLRRGFKRRQARPCF